jgi:hypothetical protein
VRIGAVLLALVAAAAAADPDEKVLWSHGIPPDPDGIRTFLRSLAPGEAVLARAERAAAELASGRPARRRHAMDRLQELGAAAIPALAAAAESDDPDVARRARELLDSARAMRETVATAAFRVIAAQRMKGLAADVLAARPALQKRHSRLAAEEALVATVTPEDAAELRRRVVEGDPQERALAVAGYAAAAGRASKPALRGWLGRESERIRLAAAWALADLGDAACLPAFAELLDAAAVEVRLGAASALRQISGQRFGYVAHADAGERTAAVLAWGDWVSGHADTARWTMPVPRVPRFLGRILVTQYNARRVLEFDLKGRKLWEREVTAAAWACAGTPEGHRLVAEVRGGRVVEFDARGRTIRTFEGLQGFPTAVQRLPNGNTLVAVALPAHTLIEFDGDGRRVWECTIGGFLADAERLPNGRTLLALYRDNRVVEIDATGRVVWEIPGVDMPYSVHRLDNGNTLVCETRAKRVVEYTRDGRAVWKHTLSAGCMGARRLPDGRTLVSTGSGVVFVDRDGSETWLLRGKGAVRANFH